MSTVPPDQLPAPLSLVDAPDTALDAEVRFIDDWERGTIPFLGAIVRVRQIDRANPWILDRSNVSASSRP